MLIGTEYTCLVNAHKNLRMCGVDQNGPILIYTSRKVSQYLNIIIGRSRQANVTSAQKPWGGVLCLSTGKA